MATKRNSILSVFETRMKTIDGTGNFVWNLNNNVTRVIERPLIRKEDFTTFPSMLYRTRPNIGTIYKLGGILQETFEVETFTAFDQRLNGLQFDDLHSDVMIALGSDVTMGGLAAYFIMIAAEGTWIQEEELTEVVNVFRCEFRHTISER